jgi:GNAT superfamily N-acetyltransferase
VTNLLNIQAATPSDVPAIFALIKALAEYEKLSHLVSGSAEALAEHLFGDRPYIEAIVAQWETKTVGFALFFANYSTFLTKPGIYLEDLFVLPEYRRRGIAKAMLTYLAKEAIARGAGRLEWSVLDWNEPAINFYKSIGAVILEEWRICRVMDDSISRLAQEENQRN